MAKLKETLKITLIYAMKDRFIANQIVQILKENNCEVYTFDDYARSLNSNFLLIDTTENPLAEDMLYDLYATLGLTIVNSISASSGL